MLFVITLAGFGVCLTVVFVTEQARVSMQTRRRRAEETMLAPPSGQPTVVPTPSTAPR